MLVKNLQWWLISILKWQWGSKKLYSFYNFGNFLQWWLFGGSYASVVLWEIMGGNASEYDVVVVTFVLTLKLIEQNSLREKLKYMNKMKLESKILILDMYKRFLFICFLYYYNTPWRLYLQSRISCEEGGRLDRQIQWWWWWWYKETKYDCRIVAGLVRTTYYY